MRLNKRIEKLETKTNKWKPVYMAFIENDGTVSVSSAKEKFTLPSAKALDVWANKNGLMNSNQVQLIKVITE